MDEEHMTVVQFMLAAIACTAFFCLIVLLGVALS